MQILVQIKPYKVMLRFLAMCFYSTMSSKIGLVSRELLPFLSFLHMIIDWLSTLHRWMFLWTADDSTVDSLLARGNIHWVWVEVEVSEKKLLRLCCRSLRSCKSEGKAAWCAHDFYASQFQLEILQSTGKRSPSALSSETAVSVNSIPESAVWEIRAFSHCLRDKPICQLLT